MLPRIQKEMAESENKSFSRGCRSVKSIVALIESSSHQNQSGHTLNRSYSSPLCSISKNNEIASTLHQLEKPHYIASSTSLQCSGGSTQQSICQPLDVDTPLQQNEAFTLAYEDQCSSDQPSVYSNYTMLRCCKSYSKGAMNQENEFSITTKELASEVVARNAERSSADVLAF